MLTQDKKTSFWVISDTHLIADSLHDDGQAFSQMQKLVRARIFIIKKLLLVLLLEWQKKRSLQQLLLRGM